MLVLLKNRSALPVERLLVAAAFVFAIGLIFQSSVVMLSAAVVAGAAAAFGGARGLLVAMRAGRGAGVPWASPSVRPPRRGR